MAVTSRSGCHYLTATGDKINQLLEPVALVVSNTAVTAAAIAITEGDTAGTTLFTVQLSPTDSVVIEFPRPKQFVRGLGLGTASATLTILL